MDADFSVIIPTKNRALYLEEAIKSIIKQHKVKIEIIVIDDKSDDNTAEIIKKYQKKINIKYLKNEVSLFAHGSRKKGYHIASGNYIVFMDDDDYYIDSNFFYSAKKIFDDNEKISTVIGSTIKYENGVYKDQLDLNVEGYILRKEFLNHFNEKYKKPMSSLTLIIRKEKLDMMKLSDCRMINDSCIYIYGISSGDIYIINKPVAAYRVHSSNISNKKFKINFIKDNLYEKRKMFKILKKNNDLIKPDEWYYNQLSPTVYYFIINSGKNIAILLYLFIWVLIFGSGSRKEFLKRLIKNNNN